MTIDDFELLPHIDGFQELFDGVIVEMPPPKLRHTVICRAIETILLRRLVKSHVWVETGFLIGPHCVQPDVAAIHPGQARERGWFSGAPLVAIEVASRGNSPEELERKKDLYLDNGASEVWIAYDRTGIVVVHRGSEAVRFRSEFLSDAIRARFSVPDILAPAS